MTQFEYYSHNKMSQVKKDLSSLISALSISLTPLETVIDTH